MILTDPILVDMLRNAYPVVWHTSSSKKEQIMPEHKKTKTGDEITAVFAQSASLLLDFDALRIDKKDVPDALNYAFLLNGGENAAFIFSHIKKNTLFYKYPISSDTFFPVFDETKLEKLQKKYPKVFDLIAFNQLSLLDDNDRTSLIETVENAFTGEWVSPDVCEVMSDKGPIQPIDVTDLIKTTKTPVFKIKDIRKFSATMTPNYCQTLAKNTQKIKSALQYLYHINAIEAQNPAAADFFTPTILLLEDYDTFITPEYDYKDIAYFDVMQNTFIPSLPPRPVLEEYSYLPLDKDHGAGALSRLLSGSDTRILYASVFGLFDPQMISYRRKTKTKHRLELLSKILNTNIQIDAVVICDSITSAWNKQALIDAYVSSELSYLSAIKSYDLLDKTLLSDLHKQLYQIQLQDNISLEEIVKSETIQNILKEIALNVTKAILKDDTLATDKNINLIQNALSNLSLNNDTLVLIQKNISAIEEEYQYNHEQKAHFKNIFLQLKKRNITLFSLDHLSWNGFGISAYQNDYVYPAVEFCPEHAVPSKTLLFKNSGINFINSITGNPTFNEATKEGRRKLRDSQGGDLIVASLASLFAKARTKNNTLSVTEFFELATKSSKFIQNTTNDRGGHIVNVPHFIQCVKTYFIAQNIYPAVTLEEFVEFITILSTLVVYSKSRSLPNLGQFKQYISLYAKIKAHKPSMTIKQYFTLTQLTKKKTKSGYVLDTRSFLKQFIS